MLILALGYPSMPVESRAYLLFSAILFLLQFVVGIDFGTTFSGYSFAKYADLPEKPLDANLNVVCRIILMDWVFSTFFVRPHFCSLAR